MDQPHFEGGEASPEEQAPPSFLETSQIRALPDRKLPRTSMGGDDALLIYLNQVRQYPRLEHEETLDLARDMRAAREATHDTADSDHAQLRERFITSQLRLVVRIAKRFPRFPGWDLLDNIQEGNIGLEYAVDRFDPEKGFYFSTYANLWIREAISRAINQRGRSMRLPGLLRDELTRALRAEPTPGVAAWGEDFTGELGQAYRAITPTSLNASTDNDGAGLEAFLPSPNPGPEQRALEAITLASLRTFIYGSDTLTERQRLALQLRYLDPDRPDTTLKEVGQQMGISMQAAGALVSNGLAVLRAYLSDMA